MLRQFIDIVCNNFSHYFCMAIVNELAGMGTAVNG